MDLNSAFFHGTSTEVNVNQPLKYCPLSPSRSANKQEYNLLGIYRSYSKIHEYLITNK